MLAEEVPFVAMAEDAVVDEGVVGAVSPPLPVDVERLDKEATV